MSEKEQLKCYTFTKDAAALVIMLGILGEWIKSYPVEAFPEPDMEKAGKVLSENGISLGDISASSIRSLLGHRINAYEDELISQMKE